MRNSSHLKAANTIYGNSNAAARPRVRPVPTEGRNLSATPCVCPADAAQHVFAAPQAQVEKMDAAAPVVGPPPFVVPSDYKHAWSAEDAAKYPGGPMTPSRWREVFAKVADEMPCVLLSRPLDVAALDHEQICAAIQAVEYGLKCHAHGPGDAWLYFAGSLTRPLEEVKKDVGAFFKKYHAISEGWDRAESLLAERDYARHEVSKINDQLAETIADYNIAVDEFQSVRGLVLALHPSEDLPMFDDEKIYVALADYASKQGRLREDLRSAQNAAKYETDRRERAEKALDRALAENLRLQKLASAVEQKRRGVAR